MIIYKKSNTEENLIWPSFDVLVHIAESSLVILFYNKPSDKCTVENVASLFGPWNPSVKCQTLVLQSKENGAAFNMFKSFCSKKPATLEPTTKGLSFPKHSNTNALRGFSENWSSQFGHLC